KMQSYLSSIEIKRSEFLNQNEVPDELIPYLLIGASYFERMNGVALTEYWNKSTFTNRDEFFVLVTYPTVQVHSGSNSILILILRLAVGDRFPIVR
ncbi:MAG: hypothetical protein ACXVPY_15775, partial [Bacteroidia bacterium]